MPQTQHWTNKSSKHDIWRPLKKREKSGVNMSEMVIDEKVARNDFVSSAAESLG